MEIHKLEQKVKSLILEKIKEKYNGHFPVLGYTMDNVYDMAYTDIMALGNNMGDVKKAAQSIYEIQNFGGPENLRFLSTLKKRVKRTKAMFQKEVLVYSEMYNNHNLGMDPESIYKIVETNY